MTELNTPQKCQRCNGCGQIANSEDGEPWTMWKSLPPGSDMAVKMGIVKPVECPQCKGTRDEPQPTQEAARVDIDELEKYSQTLLCQRNDWTATDQFWKEVDFWKKNAPIILAELRKLLEKNDNQTELLAINFNWRRRLEEELAASQEREQRLREMLKCSKRLDKDLVLIWWTDIEIDAALAKPD